MTDAQNPFLSKIMTQANSGLRWLFALLLLIILLPSGSVGFTALHTIAVAFFLTGAIAVATASPQASVRGAYVTCLAIGLLLAAWILFQAFGFAGNPFANPIWQEAEKFYGPMRESISVSPGDTLQGLIAVLLPFASFLIVLVIVRNDSHAIFMLRAIVWAGAAIAVIGLIQFVFFPKALLFDTKKFYLGQLTAVFIYHNAAANYLGMMMILSAGLAFNALQNAGTRSFFRSLLGMPSMTNRKDMLRTILYGAATALFFIDLMVTKSRAGVASSIIGLSLMFSILGYFGTRSASLRAQGGLVRRTPRWKRFARAAAILAVVLFLGLAFAQQAIMRATIAGTNDLRFCFYPGVVRMLGDNWVIGTGFGTFRDVFPAYRDPTCEMRLTLAEAHNFYLEGWITLGLPFVLALATAVVGLVIHLIAGIRDRRSLRWIPAAALGILIQQSLHSGIDFVLQNPGISVIFATLMGIAVVVSKGRAAKPRPE